jgi:hypothetical protein
VGFVFASVMTMRRIAFWLSLTVPALAVVWGAWCANFPLGVAGEWEWKRIDPSGSVALVFGPPLVAASLFIAFVALALPRVERSRPVELTGWLCGLWLCGFTWLWIVQECAPENYQLSKTTWVLYFRGSSGYYSEATGKARDLPAYLARYEAEMRKGDVLHIGTHPPGLVVVFRGLLWMCEIFPALTDALTATEPESVRGSFRELLQTARHKQDPLPRSDRAALWLATLLLQGAAAATVFPLFGLLRRTVSRRASWLAAVFWPSIPALAVFVPKSDCLYPLLALSFLWLWFTGLDRRSRSFCTLAGLSFWMGMLLSLAFLPVALIAFLATLFQAARLPSSPGECPAGPGPARNRGEQWSGLKELWLGSSARTSLAAWALAGFMVPCLLAWLILQINLPAVWWLNSRNHAGFYEQFPRTYWKWLLVNPIEFAIAAGIPLAMLAIWSIVRQWRLSEARPTWHISAWLVSIGLLWLTGKNMGEAARLWIFLTPFLIWFAGPLFDPPVLASTVSPGGASGNRGATAGWNFLAGFNWIGALAVQFATTTAIVTRVVGFHYP